MLFFLLLKAAPAMDHPSADDDYSTRKIWLEIDSQILNALFCVAGFGLHPGASTTFTVWSRSFISTTSAMAPLMEQNQAWFRPSAEYDDPEAEKGTTTFTGVRAPRTALWKLAFTVDMMMLNTTFQAVLCYFMWGYNRFDQPTWATGELIPPHLYFGALVLIKHRNIHPSGMWRVRARRPHVVVGRPKGQEDRGAWGQDYRSIDWGKTQ